MKIRVNGKAMAWQGSLKELKAKICPDADLILCNGLPVGEDHKVGEGSVIYLINKAAGVDEEVMEELLTCRHSPGLQGLIKGQRVVVLGLGGIGSQLAVNLTRLGIGTLRLVDFDVVDPTNIHRQHYNLTHLGLAKTEALVSQLRDINPFVAFEIQNVKVTADNIGDLVAGTDYIMEAFDGARDKAMVAQYHLMNPGGRTLISCSGMAGDGPGSDIRVKKQKDNWYIVGDGVTGVSEEVGLMSPRVSICAGQMANCWLRLIQGKY